jgi:alkylhydroperoxidase family enzyme
MGMDGGMDEGTDGWSEGLSPGALAPEVLADFAQLVPASRAAIGPARWQTVARAVAASLGAGVATADAGAAPRPPDANPDPTPDTPPDQSILVERVAEQFVVDVAGLSDDLRTALVDGLGAGAAFGLVQVIWVLDWATRVDLAWRQLFDVAPAHAADRADRVDALEGASPSDDLDLWPAMEAFMAAVARLDAVDPLTTELVRLRGARAHNCRLCRSRRYVRAVAAGADEATFDQIDDYEHSLLTGPQKVALRLVDALVWTPGAYPPDLAAQVRAAFTPAQTVELVLDVVRNSANKIAVALGADQAQVAEGEVELYDVTPDGEVIVGVSLS